MKDNLTKVYIQFSQPLRVMSVTPKVHRRSFVNMARLLTVKWLEGRRRISIKPKLKPGRPLPRTIYLTIETK